MRCLTEKRKRIPQVPSQMQRREKMPRMQRRKQTPRQVVEGKKMPSQFSCRLHSPGPPNGPAQLRRAAGPSRKTARHLSPETREGRCPREAGAELREAVCRWGVVLPEEGAEPPPWVVGVPCCRTQLWGEGRVFCPTLTRTTLLPCWPCLPSPLSMGVSVSVAVLLSPLCTQTKHISVSDSRSASVAVVLSRFVCTNQTHLCECQHCCVVSFPVPKPNTSGCDCECLCHCVVVSFPVPKPNTSVCDRDCLCHCVVSFPVPKPNISVCDCECQCRFVVSFPVPKPNTSVCDCECHCRCVVVSFPVPKPNASLCVTLRVPLLLCCLILCTQTKHISVCDCECQCCCGVVSFRVHKPNTSVSANVTVLSHFVYTNQTHLCVWLWVPVSLCCWLILCTQTKCISVCDSVGFGIRCVLSTQLLS